MRRCRKIAIIDDDENLLEDLAVFLQQSGFTVHTYSRGDDALAAIKEKPDRFAALAADRVMHDLGGLELMRKIRECFISWPVPVIIMTGCNCSKKEIITAMNQGAYFCITKPFAPSDLAVLLNSAIMRSEHLQVRKNENAGILGTCDLGCFTIKNFSEAWDFSSTIAALCADPEAAVIAASELLINAIEHGNLGLSYEDKTRLLLGDQYEKAIYRLLNSKEHRQKSVRVTLRKLNGFVQLLIRDQGKGFDYHKYLDPDFFRNDHLHGRGIAMAAMHSTVAYHKEGSEVMIELPAKRHWV
ncbi:MAG: hypothetical protein A2096_16535 [Spirochaetes bacterium GWF1_41_5]|nr:MAG: hypothetical protein A2096_16535 [Spirochaetes bacterium GWF1_41_5]HBE01630.1 hypothetical protein [Spirochaetia bacterium]